MNRQPFSLIFYAFGLASAAACFDAGEEAETISVVQSELGGGWWSPVITNTPYPVYCGSSFHNNQSRYAADIQAPFGTDVYAAKEGRIEAVVKNDPGESGYGRYVKIAPADGVGKRHLYAHLSEVAPGIDVGALVSRGQRLGKVGNSGNVGAHLHFHVQDGPGPHSGVGTNLIGMYGFTANSNYPSVFATCGSMGRPGVSGPTNPGPSCPCPTSPGFDNYCGHPPNTPGCPMTSPGGYCDPNGDGGYADGDWGRGFNEFQAQCR
jgi:murein DD-endopeptidase MepM/ murein hydrolase activator NlpD